MTSTLLTPAYRLTFRQQGGASTALLSSASGGKVIDTTSEPKASTLVELVVTLDMDTPADGFTLVMGQVGSFRPARGDQVKIELGYQDGAFEQVMMGEVSFVDGGLTIRRLTGRAATCQLLRAYSNNHYEGQTAGAIVRDLASQAGVEIATCQDGTYFPAYVVDGRRSSYQHMLDLATLCGFDLYINQQGKLVFEEFLGGRTAHVFEYGKHIIEVQFHQAEPRAGQVEAWGESPGGGRAAEAWAWLTKDFNASKGTAGSGDDVLLLERSALRTAQAARRAAEARYRQVQRRALRGRVRLTGQPQVHLGDAIHLKSLPDNAFNATYQVRAIRHRITKAGGFTTEIDFLSLMP